MHPIANWKTNHPGALPPQIKAIARASMQATRSLRCLPSFVIIGAQRAGTTSLLNYLASHPQVGVSLRKEVHFFDSPNHRKGLDWYQGHFPTKFTMRLRAGRGSNYAIGEATPYYIFYPHTPERIKDALPDVKIIALLRDPVERAFSQHRRNIVHGWEHLAALEAFESEEARLEDINDRIASDPHFHSSDHIHYSYKARGVYVDQIARWYATFPREQLLVLRSEDLFHRTVRTLQEVTAFLEIGSLARQGYPAFNANRSASTESLARAFLVDYFLPYNEMLADLLHRSMDWD